MIPFAIANARVFYQDCESLEIRLLELMPDGFAFRVPHSHEKKKIDHFVLHFFCYDRQDYKELILSNFSITETRRKDYYTLFRICTTQNDFHQASQHLSKEYLDYIELKLYSDDETLSHVMTSAPSSEEISMSSSVSRQRQIWAEEIRADFQKDSWTFLNDDSDLQWILALETREELKDFLETDPQILWENHWKEHGLSWHPLTKERVSGIEIGNSFCPSLLPDLSLILRVMRRVLEYHFVMSVSIPPLSQSVYESMLEYLEILHNMACENDINLCLYCNDMGIYQKLIKEQWSHFQVDKGILMNKKGKDPRVKYRTPSQHYSQTFYAEDPLDELEQQIYLPYYQTNTATFCSMYAACRFSDRSRISRVLQCPHYCSRYHFLYPDYLHVIGQYNSVFAMNQTCLKNGHFLKKYFDAGKRKVVIRL